MEHWGLPAQQPAAAQPPAVQAPAGGVPATPGLPSAGFGSAMRSLVGRKLKEMVGRRWQGMSPRARMAEATRRAAGEMARRIERETGHRPAESTIRRAARENRTPRGADQGRLDRQSRIDQAGGLKPFAQQTGVNPRAASRWRDDGRPLTPEAARVTADVEGTLWVDGEAYPRALTVHVVVTGPAADDLRAAYAVYDLESIAELLGPPITQQVDWAGEADRRFEVDEITDIDVQ